MSRDRARGLPRRGALFAPWLAPHNPFDLRTLNLLDALPPPAWLDGGEAGYLLGTDDQGRDVLSAIMFGARISLLVGLASVALAMVLGVALGPRRRLRRRHGSTRSSCASPTSSCRSRRS